MPGEPLPDDASGFRSANAALRAAVEAKDAENALLRAELDAERELRKRLELRLAELERRLGMDSTDSGTPSSKERIGAREARRARQQSERERSKDRKRGGQPGHQGKGLRRDPDPDDRKGAEPPAKCRACKASLDGAKAVKPRWAQVIDVEVMRCPDFPDRDPIGSLSGKERDRVPGKSKRYSAEFKEQAARKVIDGPLPIAQVARELGINDTTLGFWVKAYRKKISGQPIPEGTPDNERILELERRNRELEMEVSFLRKAAAYVCPER